MKKTIFLLLAILSGLQLNAQQWNCLTPAPPESFRQKLLHQNQEASAYRISSTGTRKISLYMHIIVVDYTSTSTPAQLQMMVSDANQYFASANMEFIICGFEYVYLAPNISGWSGPLMSYLAQNNDKYGYINVYTTDNIPGAAAVATFPGPGSPDQIFMGGELFSNNFPMSSTAAIFAHELGHIFSLQHTHANIAGPVGTDELVNGSNCSTSGDFLCDTPADPNLIALPNRVDSLCVYRDSVTTDLNGDLFNPDTRNIMSATRHFCYDHFSPMQLSQMRYCLDNDRNYLKTGELGITVENSERRVCIYDADITLTATPAGGIFSGDGLSGNVFSPAAAGPGNHLITYTLPGISDTVISADQYSTYPDTSLSLTQCSQSFVPSIDANLQDISVYLSNTQVQDVVLRIYAGNNTSGILLSEDTITIQPDTIPLWYDLPLDTPLALTNGSAYTYSLEFSSATGVHGSFSNRYNSGAGDSLTDFSFITHMLPNEGNCGNNSFFTISVISPNKPTLEDIVPTICVSAPPVTLRGVPPGGDLLINSNPDSVLVPMAFGTGIHMIYYNVYDRYGCASDTTILINIIDDNVTINGLNAVLCPDVVAGPVTGNPAGGSMYLDGLPFTGTTIDAGLIGSGSHTLSYVYRDSLPWFNQIDQENIHDTLVSMYPIGNNFPIYQSFKAGKNGYLNKVYFRWASNDTVQALFRIFAGNDTTGVLLYSDSVGIGGNGYYNTTVWLDRDSIWLLKDSIYTFCFAATFPSNNGQIYLTDFDNYPGGECSLSNVYPPGNSRDLNFRTYIDPLYTCANDSVNNVFNVSTFPVVALGNDTSIIIGQSIVLNAGNGGAAYLWSTGATAQSISVLTSGTYWAQVTNSDGCIASDTIVVNFIVGIEQLNTSTFSIHPNPFTGATFIDLTLPDQTAAKIRLTGYDGKLIEEHSLPGGINKFSVGENILPGVYLLTIETIDQLKSIRLVKY